MAEKIDKDKFYTPREVTKLKISEILSSRYKVILMCDEKKTKIPLQSIKKGRDYMIKGQWILDFISKNNL